MSKKGSVFLYICVVAFIISIVIFYSVIGKQTPGGETKYLGENEIELFKAYEEAEKMTYYYELSAILAAKEASQDNFENDFKENFAKYVTNSGLTSNDFEFTFISSSGSTKIVAKAKKNIEVKGDVFTYTANPSFKIEVPFESSVEENVPKVDEGNAFLAV
jgi:hypothetical protein